MASNAHRDQTMEGAKARHLQVVWARKVQALARQTRFSEDQLQALCLIFHKICEAHEWWGSGMSRGRGDRLDLAGFRDGTSALMDMTGTAELDALFSAQDPNNKRYVTANRWIRTLDAIKGSPGERARLCWLTFPKEEGSATISLSLMAKYARAMFVDVGLDDFGGFCKEFVDAALKGTTAGKEGFLTQKQYLSLAARSPLFEEFLLGVLPSREALDTFLATFSPPPRPSRRKRP